MVRAYVLIEMAAGYSRDLVATLEKRGSIRDIARVTGPFDVILELEASDIDELSNIVAEEIHALPGVVRTTTCVCLG